MIRCVISVEDCANRHRYLDTGLKFRGHLNRTDHTISSPDGSKVFDGGERGAGEGSTAGVELRKYRGTKMELKSPSIEGPCLVSY